MADKINTGLNVWARLSALWAKSRDGFFIGLVVIGCAFFLWKGNGNEGKWQKLYEKERQANATCEAEKAVQIAAQNRRYDSLLTAYTLFLQGYAPIAQRQLQRTEELKDSIRLIKNTQP